VIVRVKNKVLPKEQAQLLTNFVEALDEINDFKIRYN